MVQDASIEIKTELQLRNRMTDAMDDDIAATWNKIPASIRNDPCFRAFREELEGIHGNLFNILMNSSRFNFIFTQMKQSQHNMNY